MTHKERLYNALKSEQEAKINEALLTLDMCFKNQTAIGEHTSEHFVKEASKALDKLTEARDKVDVLNTYMEGDIGNKKLLND
jgi:regulator of sirC expression with transglutaminase-like and TPR domain|tara:strand:+ start:314 stop:559 length:246 start_codon:yes stop_codon:yes gene_type:complete